MPPDPRDALEAFAPRLAAHVDQLNALPHPALQALEARAAADGFPIVGPAVGRLLYLLTCLTRPRRIFELGSGFGYSALWFALAARDAGLTATTITLTDGDPTLLDQARRHLDDAGLLAFADLRCGDALDLLAADSGPPLDLVLLDIDKERYLQALDPILHRLAPGGLLIVDNALWYGRTLPPAQTDPATQGVIALNDALLAHPDLVTTILSVRDGVAVAWKRVPPAA